MACEVGLMYGYELDYILDQPCTIVDMWYRWGMYRRGVELYDKSYFAIRL